MSALSREVRSSVSDLEIGPWYPISRLAVATASVEAPSGTDDRLVPRAVELDLGAALRLGARERATHHAGHLELAAHDADVAADRAARADDGRELVVDRGQEGGPGVSHERDDALGAGVHQVQHVV